jgi:hypothetical protein
LTWSVWNTCPLKKKGKNGLSNTILTSRKQSKEKNTQLQIAQAKSTMAMLHLLESTIVYLKKSRFTQRTNRKSSFLIKTRINGVANISLKSNTNPKLNKSPLAHKNSLLMLMFSTDAPISPTKAGNLDA